MILICLTCSWMLLGITRAVQVQVAQGLLKGSVQELVTKDGSYYSFKGIPYAQPPIGDLRFMPPRNPDSWEGVRPALEHAPICYQTDNPSGSEDCLYLNVYTPTNLEPSAPYAVMVYIHGGGFTSGSGNSDYHSPDFLIPYDVILVTINYRLDVLGFLSLENDLVPGNNGLKDQVAALKWVQQNIQSFGGNPSEVTIFGQDAGAASVGYHIISPASSGLYRRAIMMSGSPLSDWASSPYPRLHASLLAEKLGLYTTNDDDLLHFLQSQPIGNLFNKTIHVVPWDRIGNEFKLKAFGPSIETSGNDRFITKKPMELLYSGKFENLDLLIGYVSEEGLIAFPSYSKQYATMNQYLEYFLTRRMAYESDAETILDAGNRIKRRYLDKKVASAESNAEISEFYSWVAFKYDIQKFFKLLPESSSVNKYVYNFNIQTERNWNSKLYGPKGSVKGVCHNDDLPYIFHQPAANLSVATSSYSYSLVRQVASMWTNFAKHGNPTPEHSMNFTWPLWTYSKQEYVNIEPLSLTNRGRLDAEEYDFWDNLYWEVIWQYK